VFARSLARQLCRIDGFALGILKDSDITIQATQNIQSVYGQAIAVRIDNLTVNVSGARAFTHIVAEPLRALYARGYNQPITILVDALDEAVQLKGTDTIVDLLANVGTLPHQVRFILTSRLEGTTLSQFEQRNPPRLLLDAGRAENKVDVGVYVRRQLTTNPALAARVPAPEPFVTRLIEASDGNFLYLTMLLPAVARGEIAPDAPADAATAGRPSTRSNALGMRGLVKRSFRSVAIYSRTGYRAVLPSFQYHRPIS
jgi:hypothetical protein